MLANGSPLHGAVEPTVNVNVRRFSTINSGELIEIVSVRQASSPSCLCAHTEAMTLTPTEGTIVDSTSNNALLAPIAEECLACYLDRAMYTASCDGTSKAIEHFADTNAPRQHMLPEDIKADGNHCDCEFRMNVITITEMVEHDAREG